MPALPVLDTAAIAASDPVIRVTLMVLTLVICGAVMFGYWQHRRNLKQSRKPKRKRKRKPVTASEPIDDAPTTLI